MESARKINTNRMVAQFAGSSDGKVFVYEPGSDPAFTNFYSGLGLSCPPAILRELNPEISFPPNSILVAAYDMRRHISPSLVNSLNSDVCCILYGRELLPDNIVNQPQIQLITHNPQYVRDFLSAKGVKFRDVPFPVPPKEIHHAVPQLVSQPAPSALQKQQSDHSLFKDVKSAKFFGDTGAKSKEKTESLVGSPVPASTPRTFQSSPQTSPQGTQVFLEGDPTGAPGGAVFAKEWVVKKKPNTGFFAIYPEGDDERAYFRQPTLTLKPNTGSNPASRITMEPSQSPPSQFLKKTSSGAEYNANQKSQQLESPVQPPRWAAGGGYPYGAIPIPASDTSLDLRQRTSIQIQNPLLQGPAQSSGFRFSPMAKPNQSPFPTGIPMTQSIQPTAEYDSMYSPSQIAVNSKPSLLRDGVQGVRQTAVP